MGNEVLTLADWGAILADKINIAMNNGENHVIIGMPSYVATAYMIDLYHKGFDVNIRPAGRGQQKTNLVIGW